MLLKLTPTEEQHHALLETMHAFNAAANYVAQAAFARLDNNLARVRWIGELRTDRGHDGDRAKAIGHVILDDHRGPCLLNLGAEGGIE